MSKREIEKGVGYWVLLTANLLERVANEEFTPHGITYRQVQVLGTLAVAGDLSQTDLAERIQVEPSTIVRILDRMERDGWIERVSSPTDRRVKLIRTTARVEPVWKTIRQCGVRIRERMTKGLTNSQVEELIQRLERISRNLGDSDE